MHKNKLCFLLFFPACLILASCGVKVPFISSINPSIGIPGDAMIIEGKNFGAAQNDSYITVAGISPIQASYLGWKDTSISVRIPDLGSNTGGLVFVYVGRKKSNAALFSLRSSLPAMATNEAGRVPLIKSINPATAAVGSVLSLVGSGFGSSLPAGNDAGVFFTWNSETQPSLKAACESWSDREISVRVPDGAATGPLEVQIGKAKPASFSFNLSPPPGTRAWNDEKSYSLAYSVNLQAAKSGTVYLWMPIPLLTSNQREVKLLERSMEPYIDNYHGDGLYMLKASDWPQGNTSLVLSYKVSVYAFQSKINAALVKAGKALNKSPEEKTYSQPSILVPSSDQNVMREAAAIVGKQSNPYIKAQLIYNWMLKNITVTNEGTPLANDALGTLQNRTSGSYGASLLYCALCRAAGLAAAPLAGVLVDSNSLANNHYWAQIWIPSFGWFPVDIALGEGVTEEGSSFTLPPNYAAYYFGSLDSSHIVFSRGEKNLSPMDSRGQTAGRDPSYALQNIWEEEVGCVNYSSLWSGISIK
jgi:hypothetical protein